MDIKCPSCVRVFRLTSVIHDGSATCPHCGASVSFAPPPRSTGPTRVRPDPTETSSAYGYPFARAYIAMARILAIIIVLGSVAASLFALINAISVRRCAFLKPAMMELIAEARTNNAKASVVFSTSGITATDISPQLESVEKRVSSSSVDTIAYTLIGELISSYEELTSAISSAVAKSLGDREASAQLESRGIRFAARCNDLRSRVSVDISRSNGLFLSSGTTLFIGLLAAFAICVIADFLRAHIDIALNTRAALE